MEKELGQGEESSPTTATPGIAKGKELAMRKVFIIDLALIRGLGFYLGIKRKENEFFTTSLYEIDRIIEEKTTPMLKESEEEML
jgi:hypothetical protein